ncbi:hypothetical protein XA68_11397 [Ophiocordyceps unilateralis]|uniref:Alpha/beta hydrolase fold-3 domain-containing protein n=1 Tax=Ophiocordyceps unilateralis TaxID=268505 RepID=A0A2A9P1J6_OPHUN|nr:hypothetical protein XA68_11397 [Ophiocordyceps unilateralis]
MKPQLSATEKLRLAVRLLTVAPLKLSYYAAQLALFAVRNRLPVRLYVKCATARFALGSLSAREVQYMQPGTEEAYRSWMKDKARRTPDRVRLEPDVQRLDSADGGAILWMGNRRAASKVVLFFHGGGFCIPAGRGHFEWCWNAYVQTGMETGVEVAVAFLRYSLSPEARFPVQLRQQVAALKAILASGLPPSDIIIGGDSAGGNLVTQLLGHILHPHPDVDSIQLSRPLAGAFAVSPWLSCDTNMRGFRENGRSDMLCAQSIQSLALTYFGSEAALHSAQRGQNGWVLPMDADETWLLGVDALVSSLYVTAGSREVLVDDARWLVRALKAANCEVLFHEAGGEAHDFVLLEGDVAEVGEATKRIKEWFRSVIVSRTG